jgi:parallel beta-helix repeat protein
LPFSQEIPRNLNQFLDNSTHRLVTDEQIASWDAKGDGTVKSVNNIAPDANGNVTVTVSPAGLSGTSMERPIDPAIGTPFFDTTLSKPIWYKGSGVWVDATSATMSAPVDTTPPNPITSLTTGTISSNSIVLNWTKSSSGDVANQEVAYSSDGGTTYTVATNTLNSSVITYTVNGLTASTVYTFRIIAIDTSGNRSTAVTVTGTTVSGTATSVVSDDFNRTDTTTGAGTTDSYNGGTNKTWTAFGTGGLGISSNKLYAPTGTGAAYVDAGTADARMEVTIVTVGNGHNFYFRVDSNSRYYRYAYNSSGWYLQEQNATFTTVATITGGPVLKANDVVAVEVQGGTSKLYVNTTLVHTDTITDLLTNTGFGIGFNSTPIGYVDNFNIIPLAPVSGGGTTPPPTPPTTSTGPITPKPLSYVEVTAYGATGSDSTDDTAKIQSAINDASAKGVAVSFPAGTYWINLSTGLSIPSNMTVWFDQGAIIKGLTSSLTSYQMLRLWGVSNVSILGYPTLIGDKAARPANTSSEGGMGISLANASNITIENANVSYCMGDGIYLGDYSGTPYNKTITIKNSTFDRNNRQGMSVISAIDLTVDSCIFSNTSGNPAGPCAGVDFEPNKATQYMQNLNFTNCQFINNLGHGVWGDLYYMNTSGHPISITVSNSTVTGNSGSIYGTPGVQSQIATRSTVPGYVKVNGTYIYNK